MEKVPTLDDETRNGSIISGLSSVEDDTDEFGRMVLQHARDEQRINQALQGSGQAFAKARPRPRIALTLDNLERNDAGRRPFVAEDGEITARPASVGSGSNDSEPPLNVPRGWGRKGRQTNGWMRRMREPSITLEYGHGQNDEGSKVDWVAANQPTHALQNGTPQSSNRRQHMQRVTQDHNTFIEDIHESELGQDLTAASLLASTPAISTRNTALNNIRRREVVTVEQRAVATSRLDHIRARTPSDSQRWRSSSERANGRAELKHLDRPNGAGVAVSPEMKRSPGPGSLHSDKENVPLFERHEREAQNDSRESIKAPTPRRAENRTANSLSLLKKLTREVHSSPSEAPGNQLVSPERMRVRGSMDHMDLQRADSEPQPLSAASASSNYWVNRLLPQGRVRQTSAQAPEAVVLESEHNFKIELDGRPECQDKELHTPATDRTQLPARTPVVTGAWIDTPAQRPNTRPVLPSNDSNAFSIHGEMAPRVFSDNEYEPQELASQHSRPSSSHQQSQDEPFRPASALAELVRDARMHPQDILGESTINSLEAILDPTIDATQTLDLLAELQGQQEQLHESGRSLTQGDKNRRDELLAVDSMNKRLRAARTSIKDASRGLKRVERTIDAANEAADSSRKTSSQQPSRIVGPRYDSVFKTMWSEICEFFISNNKNRPFISRLTWLGLSCIAFWAWYATESTLWYVQSSF